MTPTFVCPFGFELKFEIIRETPWPVTINHYLELKYPWSAYWNQVLEIDCILEI